MLIIARSKMVVRRGGGRNSKDKLLTSGIAYTKLPIGLILPAASPGVDEVRNTVLQVWCRVRWMWAVVWGV